jgi:hypothetical protein
MEWLVSILLVAPVWGIISAKLFLQIFLAGIGLLIRLLGLVRGAVSWKTNLLSIGVSILSVVIYGYILYAGNRLLNIFGFRQLKSEDIVYLIFFGLSVLYMLTQFPVKLRKLWRNSMASGSLEADIFIRELGENPETFGYTEHRKSLDDEETHSFD